MKKTKHPVTALGLVLIQLLQPVIPAAAAESSESASSMSYGTILDLMTPEGFSPPIWV